MQPLSTQPAFALDPTLPWLRTDPAMQHREAFTDTYRLHLQAAYTPMAPTLPGGTEVLLTRVRDLDGLVVGGLYYMTERTPSRQDAINLERDMGRLVAVNRPRAHRTHPFAELELRYENPEANAGRYCDEQGHFYWMAHFNGFRKPFMKQAYPGYDFQLWRVTHYINPPLGEAYMQEHLAESGLSPAQQRWYEDEQQLWLHDAELAAAYSTGLDYAPTLEQVLSKSEAALLSEFLQTITPLPRSRAQQRKSPVVALTRRTRVAGSHTHFYAQQTIAPVLDLLEGMRRVRVSREMLIRQTAHYQVAQEVAALRRQHEELALAA